jgi:general stress protein YciG
MARGASCFRRVSQHCRETVSECRESPENPVNGQKGARAATSQDKLAELCRRGGEHLLAKTRRRSIPRIDVNSEFAHDTGFLALF